MTRPHVLVALAGAGVAAAACSLLVPLDEVQCRSAADCAARGAAFAGAVCVENVCTLAEAGASEGGPDAGPDVEPEAAGDASGPWGCLQVPPGASDPGATIQVDLVTFDPFVPYTLGGAVDGGNDLQVVQATPEQGVAVQPCGNLDPACLHPVAPLVLTGDAGIATFSMNGGFDGFYSMTRSDSFPTLFYPGRLLASEPAISYPVAVLPYSIAAELGAAVGVTVSTDPDAGVGHVFEAVFDCNDRHASGVSFSLNVDAGTPFYTANGVPSTSATQTDPSGAGGFLNVPAGSITAQVTIAGQAVQLPPTSVYVRPAAETLLYFRARSRPAP